ncbi:MAG: hypothetical protein FWE03_04265 [Firmicutes bacterium]|nr:hypothetical protein [Bacillota bacterium]
MKTKLKIISTLICLVMISIFAIASLSMCTFGPDEDDNTELNFERASFVYNQPQSSINQTHQAQRTITSNAAYYFVLAAMETRLAAVNQTENLLKFLQNHSFPYFDIDFNSITLYFNNSFNLRADSINNAIFLRTSDVGTYRFINFVLQTMLSRTINYGLLHGLSMRIFQELGWGTRQIYSNNQIARFLESEKNTYITSLTYGVFNKRFSNELQIYYAYSVSLALVDHIIDNNSDFKAIFTRLLKYGQYFDSRFNVLFFNKINAYLVYIGLEAILISNAVYRVFSYTYDYPIVIKTYSAYYFTHKDWLAENLLAEAYIIFSDFEFNYESFLEFLLNSEAAFEWIRQFFSWDDFIRATIRLEQIDEGYAFWVPWQTDYVLLESLWPLTQSYAVFVMISTLGFRDPNSWMTNALILYSYIMFDNNVSDNMHFIFSDRDNPIISPLISPRMRRSIELYDELFKKCDNKFDFVTYIKLTVYVALFEFDLSFNFNVNNDQVVFVLYLIYAYGVQTVFDIYINQGVLSGSVTNPARVVDEFKLWLYNIIHNRA